jgi:hypothetical protein
MPILLNAGRSTFGWSRIGNFFRCERFYALTKRDDDGGIKRLDDSAGPLARGSVGHIGAAHFYKRLQQKRLGKDPEAYYTPQEAMRLYKEKHNVEDGVYKLAVDTVERHMKVEPTSAKVVNVEDEYGAYIAYGNQGKRCRLTARFDLVLFHSGKYYIVDHKFVYKHSSQTVKDRYTISGQFLFQQTLGRKIWGKLFGGVYIHAMGVVPPFHDQYYLLDAAPGALASFLPALKEVLVRIDSLAGEPVTAYRPAFHEQVCVSAYGACLYFDECQWAVK